METQPNSETCVGKACSFFISGESLACSSGKGDCAVAEILEAEISGFHDEHLAEATRQIRAILSGIPEDPEGRKLSFLVTDMGLLLARVDHGATIPDDAITADHDDETLARALRLKGAGRSAGV